MAVVQTSRDIVSIVSDHAFGAVALIDARCGGGHSLAFGIPKIFYLGGERVLSRLNNRPIHGCHSRLDGLSGEDHR